MATAEELAKAFSFVDNLLSDTDLSQYRNNALPLYAVSLYLDVEDRAVFAIDALTDHRSDKKADIIYINEADGVACVAQGYTGADWGKPEGPANKASDLNTAVAWLIQVPIDQVPELIRPQAKLLRDGLKKKTITRVVFVFAHNSYESQNVASALDAVKHLLAGLELLRDVNVEVVELGLRRIEGLYLTSRGSIQVTDELDLPATDVIVEKGPEWETFLLSLNGETLFSLYDLYENSLFSANLRDFLGARKVSRNVNNQIRETAEKDPGNFFVFNNGVTLVTKTAQFHKDERTLHVNSISIVNGAQTTGAIHAAGREHSKNVSVLARVIIVNNEEVIPKIVAANNTQKLNSCMGPPKQRPSADPAET